VASVTERLTLAGLASLAERHPSLARYLWSPTPCVPGRGPFSGGDVPVRGAPEVVAEAVEGATVRWQAFARLRRAAVSGAAPSRRTEHGWRGVMLGPVREAGGPAAFAAVPRAGRSAEIAAATVAAMAMQSPHAWDAPLPRNPLEAEAGVLV